MASEHTKFGSKIRCCNGGRRQVLIRNLSNRSEHKRVIWHLPPLATPTNGTVLAEDCCLVLDPCSFGLLDTNHSGSQVAFFSLPPPIYIIADFIKATWPHDKSTKCKPFTRSRTVVSDAAKSSCQKSNHSKVLPLTPRASNK